MLSRKIRDGFNSFLGWAVVALPCLAVVILVRFIEGWPWWVWLLIGVPVFAAHIGLFFYTIAAIYLFSEYLKKRKKGDKG